MQTVLFKISGGGYVKPAPGPLAKIGLFIQALTGGRLTPPAARRYMEREKKHWRHHVNRVQADINRQQYRTRQAERPERPDPNDPNGLKYLNDPNELNELNGLTAFGEPVPNDFIKQLQAKGCDVSRMTTKELEALLWNELPWWETSH